VKEVLQEETMKNCSSQIKIEFKSTEETSVIDVSPKRKTYKSVMPSSNGTSKSFTVYRTQ
jgi:hypothetical protein